ICSTPRGAYWIWLSPMSPWWLGRHRPWSAAEGRLGRLGRLPPALRRSDTIHLQAHHIVYEHSLAGPEGFAVGAPYEGAVVGGVGEDLFAEGAGRAAEDLADRGLARGLRVVG